MNADNHLNRRYNKCSLKNNKAKTMESDEVATNYKLQQFLKDVQRFTEKSKKTKKNRSLRTNVTTMKQVGSKRGLFENGLRSRPCIKGILGLENRARLKGNLNDLIKECPKRREDEEEITSSSDHSSSSEGSYEIGNQQVDNNCDKMENENTFNEKKERVAASEKQFELHDYSHKKSSNLEEMNLKKMLWEKYCENAEATKRSVSKTFSDKDNIGIRFETNNQSALIIKDRNLLKQLLWQKYCEHVKTAVSVIKIPVIDHLALARKKLNEIVYENFLENARKFPSILKRIFSSDEIKKLAQIVVNDKVDKCEQTEDVSVLPDCSQLNDIISDGESTGKELPFSPSPKHCESSNNQQKEVHFFDLNPHKQNNTEVNFLESLENQPDIFSPEGHNNSCYVTPSPSLLPTHVKQYWTPNTDSTPQKPDILSPISEPHSSSFFNWQTPLIPEDQPPAKKRQAKANHMLRSIPRKMEVEPKFEENESPYSPLLYFPKRKRVTFSPHRL